MDRTGIGLLLVCLLCVSPCVLGQDMVNVAANAPLRTCSQSSVYNNLSDYCNAANGNPGGAYTLTGDSANCIHTSVGYFWLNGGRVYDRTPWWEVDLDREFPVRDITVWGREGHTHRLYPFTITVDGHQCARATSGGREHSVTCGTVINGRVVRLTREYRSGSDFSLNMCELEVWVCQSGYHRVSNRTCELCNTNCDRGCYRGNGRCDGCKPGYHGAQCDSQCSTIHYRCTQCTQDSTCTACSSNFQAPACTGCKPGYHGAQCDPCFSIHYRCTQCTQDSTCTACGNNFQAPYCTGCKPGYHGAQCDRTCSSIHNRCTQCTQDSTCTACSSNFQAPACTGCNDGRWGAQCGTPCHGTCEQCTQDTGTCTACSGFFKLPECKECLEGYFKQYSSSTRCTECTWRCMDNTVCSNITGDCADCPPGKMGNRCQQACSPGRYGSSRCAETCGQCNGGWCDAVTGHCAQCQPGWQTPLCKTPCAPLMYGENCSKSCGHCKGEQPCNATTGECTGECQPGYTGTLCKTECEAGLYGAECNQTCGHCDVNTTCHHEDGHCLVGCVAKFAGPLCLQANSQENKDDGATNVVGPIVGAIVGVGLVMTISITAAICWRRKSATSRSSVQDPPTASSISVKDAAPTVSPEPSPLRQSSSNEDNLYSEIRDPDDTYEISEMQSIYDKPSPYSNDDGDREPYMQLTLKTNNVNMPASNAAYVNTKLSV